VNELEEDLIKVLRYEVHFVRQAQENLVRHAKRLIDEAEAANRQLEILAGTLQCISEGEDWREPHREKPIPRAVAKLVKASLGKLE